MVMFEMPEEEQEGVQEDKSFEVTEAIPDVELFEYKTSTRSIHVVSGAWVQKTGYFPFSCPCASLPRQWISPNSLCVNRWIAYSHVDFSGNQYILEKGFYNNCADWGSQDNRICSVQPILLVSSAGTKRKLCFYIFSDWLLLTICLFLFFRLTVKARERPARWLSSFSQFTLFYFIDTLVASRSPAHKKPLVILVEEANQTHWLNIVLNDVSLYLLQDFFMAENL